jgi:molybdopterin-guanine dinucleotide biosynthesis protein A
VNRVIDDVYAEHGPLGGIHAELYASDSELNLILAVDLPFLDNRFLHHMIAEARASTAIVTVPEFGGRLHPLCAVYRRAFARVAEQGLASGRNKIDVLFAKVETRVIAQSELARLGFTGRMFHNLNTPEDLRALESVQKGRTRDADRVD